MISLSTMVDVIFLVAGLALVLAGVWCGRRYERAFPKGRT